ncbi:MAG: hypothetical protein CMB20_003845 [Methanobacteriota archaeon]|nr:MAG: hypothetical protein CMB20_003845 [Euryarchaeota archaeon]
MIAENDSIEVVLEDEPVKKEATSPGHPVLAEYMGAHWCGPCISATNNLKNLYNTNGDDFTFVSIWESPTTGNPSDSPINRKSHIQSASGYDNYIPKVAFGDAESGNYYTGSGPYDSLYTSGGDMVDAADYQLEVVQSENNGQMNIQITAAYLGQGTKTVHLYAAVTESIGAEAYTTGGGSDRPPHLWRKWLLNSGNSGFESFTLSAGNPVTKSWTVSTSIARATSGLSSAENFLTVAALLDGDHTSHRNVLSAADANMAPTIDVGVKSFTANNPSAPGGGYINGDTLDLQATIVNNGVDAYTDGGNVKFFYKSNNVKTYVGSTQPLNNFNSNGATQTFNGQIDTSNLPSNAYQTTFGVELSNLVADKSSSNNQRTKIIPHDLIPVARKAQVIGSSEIARGDNFLIEAKTTINDAVDINTSFFTFDVEISEADQNNWLGGENLIVGGDQVFQEGTNGEHRQYLVKPTMDMGAGDYDIRIRSIDSRMQTSAWQVTENGFKLMNAKPIITAEPIPTVKVQTTTMVPIADNINDAETPLSDLVISSSSPNFVAWHPDTQEIEVYFENIKYVNGQPTATGIEVTVNDGIENAYGTLLFNVIENGQPRWAGIAKQFVDEGSSSSTMLSSYLSDTDNQGNPSSTDDLVLAIIDNSNPELLNLELIGFTLNYETMDDDINGETTVTIRASDGQQYSDQMITIAVNPVNDAPRLDLSEYEGLRLKAGTQKVIYLSEILTDIDGNVDEVTISASNEIPGAVRHSYFDNTLTMIWDQEGIQTVTIIVEDRYDQNRYDFDVEVYDSVPLTVGQGDSGDVKIDARNVFIEEVPEVTMFLNKNDVTITSLTTTWKLCNDAVCMKNQVIEHDITMKNNGWTFDPLNGQIDESGMPGEHEEWGFHYIEVTKVVAMSDTGDKYQWAGNNLKWTANEEAPGPETLTPEELEELIDTLEAEISSKKSEMKNMEKGTTQYETAAEELAELEADKEEACGFTTTCDSASSGSVSEETGLDMTVIAIVVGVVIIALLIGLMFIRGGNRGSEPEVVDWANQLPAHDTVANSMYGGTQEIFQQPVAAPAPVVAQVPPGAPPLPPGGLPAGWTMEQWAYYGHQYYEQYRQ